MGVDKVVDNMTRESCIPVDFVKSDDNCSSLVHSIRTGAYIDSDKTNLAHQLVKIMIGRVSNI